MFPNSSFRYPISIFTSSRGEMKVAKRWTIYFCPFWDLIHLNPLTNARDMVISILVYEVLKMTRKKIDWILQPLQHPILRVSLWPAISNLQLVMWLLLLWITTQRSLNCPFSWFHPSWFIDCRDQSHSQDPFEFGGHKKLTASIGGCSGYKSCQ